MNRRMPLATVIAMGLAAGVDIGAMLPTSAPERPQDAPSPEQIRERITAAEAKRRRKNAKRLKNAGL